MKAAQAPRKLTGTESFLLCKCFHLKSYHYDCLICSFHSFSFQSNPFYYHNPHKLSAWWVNTIPCWSHCTCFFEPYKNFHAHSFSGMKIVLFWFKFIGMLSPGSNKELVITILVEIMACMLTYITQLPWTNWSYERNSETEWCLFLYDLVLYLFSVIVGNNFENVIFHLYKLRPHCNKTLTDHHCVYSPGEKQRNVVSHWLVACAKWSLHSDRYKTTNTTMPVYFFTTQQVISHFETLNKWIITL